MARVQNEGRRPFSRLPSLEVKSWRALTPQSVAEAFALDEKWRVLASGQISGSLQLACKQSNASCKLQGCASVLESSDEEEGWMVDGLEVGGEERVALSTPASRLPLGRDIVTECPLRTSRP